MRAADGDRQAVADRLKSALDEGRLDLHEYDDRLQQAYSARTYGELERLTTDLPTGRQVAATPSDDGVTRRWVIHVWDEYVTAVAICVAIWAISGLGYFWPVWVAGPWGLLLIWQTVTGLAQDEPHRWQAKADRKKEKKELKQQQQKELPE
jgi:hypothetical protein